MTEHQAVAELLDTLAASVAGGGFVKLTLAKPTPTAGDVKSIDIRPIMVKRALRLSFTTHHTTRDVVKHYAPAEAPALIAMQLAEHFRAAKLQTTGGDVQLSHAGGSYHLKRHAASVTAAPALSHDRAKQRPIEAAHAPYLHALGITDAKGVVYKTAQDKFRQINKYIEVLGALVEGLPAEKPLRIVDMGAGKGYLTFALYDYLAHRLKRAVEVVGVELRAELVKQCNDIARAAQFKGLAFVEGSIAAFDCTHADVVIALHACDTATDDALAKAVKANASLVVVAPCCHKQVRKSMAAQAEGLEFLMRYGTYHERLAEMITDGMRAQMLEISGYRVKLFEFISDAHTPKNVMIVGEKRSKALSEAERAAMLESLVRTKKDFGIAEHYLERLLR
jgi:tRNA A58 N-methylase Trm61